MIDLHTHSNASDGSFSPTQLVEQAVNIGLSALALTDHDCTKGLDEANRAAAQHPITIVNGVELSAQIDKGVLHIVGLFIDAQNPMLKKMLTVAKQARNERNPKMLKRLAELGAPIDEHRLNEIAGNGVVGRPHMAQALVEAGHVKNVNHAFNKLIGDNGPAYIHKYRFPAGECIDAIRRSGGVAIMAHPDLLKMKGPRMRAKLKWLVDQGLQGIEVFCAAYSPQQTHYYSSLAAHFGLVKSGGSDFHGVRKPGIRLGRGTGGMYIHDELLPPIQALSHTNQ